ncbi:hypothetical protein [Cellulomonas sp. RIT-PI-Y]|uniref:hypothetical protein n=1 Tax=Cellulomonas sp. RIT-PI-Y TaxID=3035297 RepID=UPI0021D7E90E|nr:hypothetical protein [Cellulomonas sp. RIT-PI-Y]
MSNRRTTWITGAALIALVLVALTWMLVVSPRIEQTSALNEEVAAAQDANGLLQIQATTLAADVARRGELEAELATLRTRVPEDAGLPEFTRLLKGLADESGAVVSTVSVGIATEVTSTPDLPSAPDGTAAPALAAPPAGMYAVPVTLTVQGTLDQAKTYAGVLQTGDHRLFLLTSLSWSSLDADGTTTVTLTGFTYVLSADAAAAVADEAGASVNSTEATG